MEYRQFVEDFVTRTLANLRLVETQGGYEVTQLVNSLYGLIVVPQQTVLELLPPTPLADLAARGWAQFSVSAADKKREKPTCDDLRQLITSLRHGIAHAKVEFDSDPAEQLASVTITNEYAGKFWRGTISLEGLRSFVTSLADMLRSPNVLDHIR